MQDILQDISRALWRIQPETRRHHTSPCRNGMTRSARAVRRQYATKSEPARKCAHRASKPRARAAGTAAKRPKPREKARKTLKRAISHDKCPETTLSTSDTCISALNTPHERTAEEYVKTLFVLFSKTPFSPEIRIVFWGRGRARSRAVTHSKRRGAPRGTTRVARFGNAAKR